MLIGTGITHLRVKGILEYGSMISFGPEQPRIDNLEFLAGIGYNQKANTAVAYDVTGTDQYRRLFDDWHQGDVFDGVKLLRVPKSRLPECRLSAKEDIFISYVEFQGLLTRYAEKKT